MWCYKKVHNTHRMKFMYQEGCSESERHNHTSSVYQCEACRATAYSYAHNGDILLPSCEAATLPCKGR